MKRLARQPEQIETLNFHAAFDAPTTEGDPSISDNDRILATVARFDAGLRDSVDSTSRLAGWLGNVLFGLIAAELGGCVLVKEEDAGTLYHDPQVKLPDWRLTLKTGEVVLVEVKVVTSKENELPTIAKLRLSEVERLSRYADLNICPLMIAIRWGAIEQWTLVPIDSFSRVRDHWEIDIETAMKHSEMGTMLGDRYLGLRPPLVMRVQLGNSELAEEGEPNSSGESPVARLEGTITGLFFDSGGKTMTDEDEKNLVWFLLNYCTWTRHEQDVVDLGDGVHELQFIVQPDEAWKEQGFAIAGSLSNLYTRFFNSQTSDAGGVTKLRVDVEPGMLPRLVPHGHQMKNLPLWHLTLQPNRK